MKLKKKNKSLSQSTIICLMMNNECVYYIYIQQKLKDAMEGFVACLNVSFQKKTFMLMAR